MPSPALPEIERSAARYLFAVSVLSDADDDTVSTGDLREYLGVAPASVTEMIAKLDDRGLVSYEKYQGATLTPRGDELAADLSWRFCVVSTFFDAELGATLDEETAFDIALALPSEGVFALRERVGASCLGLCPETGNESDECTAG